MTNLGWFLASIGGLSAAATVLEAVWVALPFTLGSDPLDVGQPGSWAQALGFHVGFVILHALASAVALACGLGLLGRRQWARRLLVAFLGACACVIVGLMLAGLLPLVMAIASGGQAEWLAWVFVIGIAAMSLAIGGAVLIVAVWMIRRLRSPEVRREFAAP